MTYQIEIRIIGEDLTPEKMSSRDIGTLIASVEQMIASIAARDTPALEVDESEVIVGLATVAQGSYVLRFETLYEAASQVAYRTATTAVATRRFDNLPPESIDAIKNIRKITRKYKTNTEFWENNGEYQQLAVVTPNTEIDVETHLISGTTTLYGYVSGIMGDDPPRVRLRLIDGTILYCNVSRKDNLRVARELGERLYTYVGVRGTARWNAGDLSLRHFLVEELTKYRQGSIEQSLDALYEVAGRFYEEYDATALVEELRGYGSEEFE